MELMTIVMEILILQTLNVKLAMILMEMDMVILLHHYVIILN